MDEQGQATYTFTGVSIGKEQTMCAHLECEDVHEVGVFNGKRCTSCGRYLIQYLATPEELERAQRTLQSR